ncbi:hypothetical protein M011DRAFT_429182 [Sporormia fimetaria CBS 119925]|uniref:FAD-binding FR-type domain-containing protein n=1 Tax=Sporormia fimetaria CBS 119925 TaxID=1340428 RepID=A0A6A6V3Z5_9PLEO|nr:hypothetical protein M011DRAFT_429182 [Sporormia fimetaria CBS 119925]
MAASIFRRPGALLVLASSAFGGAAYRYNAGPSSSSSSLNPHTFTPYTLVDKETVSRTSAIFTLRNRDGAADTEAVKDAWKHGVWSVQIKQPQLQIGRDYTPLPPRTDSEADSEEKMHDLRLLIRQEEGGEVSTYLHRLPEQSTIELRGPKLEWELPEDTQEVIFIAGGTGIAPAMQIAHTLGAKPGRRMHILWANRRREECLGGVGDGGELQETHDGLSSWKRFLGFAPPPAPAAKVDSQGQGVIVRELEALKKQGARHSSALAIQYYVDEENKFIKPQDVARNVRSKDMAQPGSRMILVSGPEGFIEHWAGKKVWIGGRETQGQLGGVLSTMDLKGWSIHKL